MGNRYETRKKVVPLQPGNNETINDMLKRTFCLFIIGVLIAACSGSRQGPDAPTAARCLEEAGAALADDSIRLGETLLRKAIRLSEASEDWHTNYIAYQRLAEALSQANPEEALRLMKKALAVYEQHPDDERNRVILLDYAGTYAAQVAFCSRARFQACQQQSGATQGAFDEALEYIHRAYDIAKQNQMADLTCQTLTSLANIAWAKEDYRQAVSYEAESVATEDLRSVQGNLQFPPDLLQGTLQVLARSYLSLNMLDSAETIYLQIEPGSDVHMAYIVQSNLARIALRRLGATEVEDSVVEAFGQVEDFYYKALEQKDEYYQETLRQEVENQQLQYRSRLYGRTLFITVVASLIVIAALVLAARYRMRVGRQEKQRLQQEAEHQKTLLHQANEVVAFLQNFILERTEVIKKLNEIGDSRVTITPHEWGEIERTLNAIDNNRFARIREQYPSMQEDDIRLCILTRLGLSNRTIGNIYCITISAVQHRKLKLKKDVFGETNPDVTLEQVLRFAKE